MAGYLIIESRDPKQFRDVEMDYGLAVDLVNQGQDVTLMLVQNGINPVNRGADTGIFSPLLYRLSYLGKGTASILIALALAGGVFIGTQVANPGASSGPQADRQGAANPEAPRVGAPSPAPKPPQTVPGKPAVAAKAAPKAPVIPAVPTAKVNPDQKAIVGAAARRKVPLGAYGKGPKDALVNIVEFSDFECPFCGRVNPTIDKIMSEYAGKVRVEFRHNPLPFHKNAPRASQAALAAGAQGKFWDMHDKLFANRSALDRASLDKYAEEIGLDMVKFKAAMDSGDLQKVIDTDLAIGKKAGVRGTPNLFINGRNLVGAQPFDRFKPIIDEEIAIAEKLLKSGVSKGKLYATLMASASDAPPPAPRKPAPPREVASKEVYKVPVAGAATKGGKLPKVTIVEFSDFQCPFCNRVNPTIAKILETYGDDVQVAFRHLPLGFHKNARPAAIAAEAARKQGKFWEMHDKLFANQRALASEDLEKYASEIGLDVEKFKTDITDTTIAKRVDDDSKFSQSIGNTGTPGFFVNGRKVSGAQPFDAFKKVIDEEMKKADAKLKTGVSREALYAEIIKNGLTKAAPRPRRPGSPDPAAVYKADATDAPSRGATDALVTVVMFSDYQCPFCSKVEPTLAKLLEDYEGKLRVVWRDLPLSFHKDAMPAAIAAREAGRQGKFWEMHDLLFKNQRQLDRASLEKYAGELSLDMTKFKAALDGQTDKAKIQADVAMGNKIGARGTPAFFINGRSLSGAQPYDNFKALVEEELKKAEAMVKKGTPAAKVYETIMKTAKTSV